MNCFHVATFALIASFLIAGSTANGLTEACLVPTQISLAGRMIDGYINRCAAEVDVQLYNAEKAKSSVHIVDGWDMDGPVPNNFIPLLMGSSFNNTQAVAASPTYRDTTVSELVEYVDCVSSFVLPSSSTLVVNGCPEALAVQYVCDGASQYIVLDAMPTSNGDTGAPATNLYELQCNAPVDIGCVVPSR